MPKKVLDAESGNKDAYVQLNNYFITRQMKGKDLFSNIQEAREHISRLKKEASLLEGTPQQSLASNIGDYMNEVIYTLNKQDHQIEQQHKDYKQKLPSIGAQQREQTSALAALKRHKHKIHSKSKHSREESTKIQDSFSFAIENRPMKMHSHHEKILRAAQFTSDKRPMVNSHADALLLQTKQERNSMPGSAHFRSRHFDKRPIRPSEFSATKSGLKSKSYIKPKPHKIVSHIFQAILGQIDYDSQEFSSYQRVYESIFPKIKAQIQRIKQILERQQIEFARIDGKKLAYLCLKQRVSEMELIGCLGDIPHRVRGEVIAEGSFRGKEGKIKAATYIAAYWRMRSIREKYLTLRKSTVIIQRFFKKKLLQLKMEKNLSDRNNRIIDDFQRRQARFAKDYRSIREQKRIEVHLASVQADEEKRLSMDYFPERQNVQLSRIFRLKDPNLIIIFISGSELAPELLTYYYRMLELAGIDNYRERLIFLTPEMTGKLPEHISTARLLYYSSNTLNQLKIITADLPTILYPGQPCNELLKICDHIGCNLFSGEPQRMKAFTTKSQTKRLLRNLCLTTLPAAMEMYDYGQFLNTFSVLIVKNPTTTTWVLKIDDQIQGRGIAYADLSTSKHLKSILRQLQNKDPETFATEVTSDPQQQEATIRVRDYLREHLHQRLQVAAPSVYRGYTDFMGRFIKKGGIIEAHPNCSPQELGTATICFQLGPDGEHRIITTFEKINGQPYRALACQFPQKIMDPSLATSTVRQLCDSFKLRKMFGVFTVDFLVQKETTHHWVLGIDSYLNNYAASYHLFDLLMDGGYMEDKNVYLVDSGSSDTLETEGSSPEERLATRQYVFVPHLQHKNLTKVRVKQFFKQARMENFNFDIANKDGICVMLLDQLGSGLLGLLSVSSSRQQANEAIKRMLDFISRVSSVKTVDYGRNELQGSSDVITLKDVLSTFAGFARKGFRKNAKQRAVRHYEMNRPLELL